MEQTQPAPTPIAPPPADAPKEAAAAKPRGRAGLTITPEGGTALKVEGKYPLPLKAEAKKININGNDVVAMKTLFKGAWITYFVVNGASFWVKGDLNLDVKYTVNFPDGYDYTPSKLDRKAAAAVSAASAKKKAEATKPNGQGQTPPPQGAAGTGEPKPEFPQPKPAEPQPEPPKGKKASR